MQSSLTCPIVNLDALINTAICWLLEDKPKSHLNQSWLVLRLLLYKFYWASRFNIFLGRNPWKAWRQIAHKTLAGELGLSREWVQKLIKRLKAEGWLETSAPRKADGKQAAMTFRPGGRLKYLLSKLIHSKNHEKNRVNAGSQFVSSPQTEAKKQTKKQTDKPIPLGWVDDVVGGLARKLNLDAKIRW